MKRKDVEQLAGAGTAELQSRLKDAETKLRELVAARQAAKLKNVHAVSALRKDIARIQTFLNRNHGE